MASSASSTTPTQAKIWWTNGSFFVAIHVAALLGILQYPVWAVPRQTLVLMVVLWQAASLGITVGYHRLYSHRAFDAGYPVKLFLALLGAAGFQGSIKWWCLRHRLHHRFTDDPVHDPYSATKGFMWSHMGWIFYKSQYDRLASIDREDLENDPVVRFQHNHYVPLALFGGFVFPTVVGVLWGDPVGAYIYGGLVARLLIWHCTFLVNSLAHWDGLQPYSDDNTSRTNLLLALLTCGEGNHNFHSFPQDYRSGPAPLDWDPSKWLILLLHYLGLASGLRCAREHDITVAKLHMLQKGHSHGPLDQEGDESHWIGEIWTSSRTLEFAKANDRCILLIDGYVVDATDYLDEHPGSNTLLRKHSLTGFVASKGTGINGLYDAGPAFMGGINKHSQAAQRRMREFRIAKLATIGTRREAED